jgi:hypothetical protein
MAGPPNFASRGAPVVALVTSSGRISVANAVPTVKTWEAVIGALVTIGAMVGCALVAFGNLDSSSSRRLFWIVSAFLAAIFGSLGFVPLSALPVIAFYAGWPGSRTEFLGDPLGCRSHDLGFDVGFCLVAILR